MSEKLLPCPWCGPRGDVQVTQYGRDYFSIKCRECGCEGPHRTMGFSLVNGEELAIDEWNTRAAMQADADLERIKRERDQAVEALRAIKSEAERENGSWVHLKRCIAAQAATTLTSIEGTGHE